MLPSFILMQGWLRQNAMSTQDRHGNSVALPLESAQRANRSSDTPRLLVLALRWFELADRADYLITRAVTAHLIPTTRPQSASAAFSSASSFMAPLKHIHEM
jgi:hypothetical protein